MGRKQKDRINEATAENGTAEITIGAPPVQKDEEPPKQDEGPESYVMGLGRTLCGTIVGLLGQGKEVKPEFLRDGQEGFDGWLKIGHIVTRAEYEAQVMAKNKR